MYARSCISCISIATKWQLSPIQLLRSVKVTARHLVYEGELILKNIGHWSDKTKQARGKKSETRYFATFIWNAKLRTISMHTIRDKRS